MTYIRVWLMMIYREGQEFARNRAGWVMPLLPPLLARVVVRPSPIGPASLWNSASWVWFAAVMPCVMLAAASLAEERERGTWTALRLAPISMGSVIMVKIGVVGVVAMASEVLLWAIIPHPTASWPLTAMVCGAGFGAFTGVVLALVADSQRATSALSAVVMVVLFVSALVYPDLPHMTSWLSLAPSVAWVHLCENEIRGDAVPIRSLYIFGAWIVLLLGIGQWTLRQQHR